MFQFTGFPSAALWIYAAVTRVFRAGFPHSDIRGSRCICHSPRLFAACHVFHRLLVPRHPPCALTACPASAIHLAINEWPLKSLLNSFLRKEKTSSFDVFSYLILCIQFSRSDTDIFFIYQLELRQPPGLPRRLQRSTFGRLGLNRRVRDGNGCDPQTHCHRKFFLHAWQINSDTIPYSSRSV